MVAISVYGRPGCNQCFATTNILKARGVPFKYFDVTEDEAAFDTVKLLGYQTLPVVVAGDMHWSGYRHPLVHRLIELYGRKENHTEPLEQPAVEYLLGGDK